MRAASRPIRKHAADSVAQRSCVSNSIAPLRRSHEARLENTPTTPVCLFSRLIMGCPRPLFGSDLIGKLSFPSDSPHFLPARGHRYAGGRFELSQALHVERTCT